MEKLNQVITKSKSEVSILALDKIELNDRELKETDIEYKHYSKTSFISTIISLAFNVLLILFLIVLCFMFRYKNNLFHYISCKMEKRHHTNMTSASPPVVASTSAGIVNDVEPL